MKSDVRGIYNIIQSIEEKLLSFIYVRRFLVCLAIVFSIKVHKLLGGFVIGFVSI